jgi:hypothetical protein
MCLPFIWRHGTAVYEDILPTPISETRWFGHIESQDIPWIYSNLLNGAKLKDTKEKKTTLSK